MSKLVFNTDTNSIIITGKTFSIKDLLKTHGARWDAATGAWSLPIAKDTPEFRAERSAAVTTAAAAKKTEAAWLKSPEGLAATRAAAAEAEKAAITLQATIRGKADRAKAAELQKAEDQLDSRAERELEKEMKEMRRERLSERHHIRLPERLGV
jgi:hypothetical protein